MIELKLKALLSLIILLIFPLLSACSSTELNTISLVTALGIDKDESGYILTYQVLNAKAIAAKKGASEAPFFVFTEKGDSLGEIDRRVLMQTSRRLNSEHIRSVVISEDLARDGLKDILDYLFRSNECRTDFYFFIAKGATANEVLSAVSPVEEASGMKIYGSIENSKKWWAPSNTLKIVELINNINSKGNSPVLVGVELYEETEKMESVKNLEGTKPAKIKLTTLCAFKDDKLIGWLDKSESATYAYIVGKGKSTAISVDYDESTNVSLDITTAKTRVKASLLDGKPVIDVKISADMIITTQTGDVDFTEEENMNKLISKVNEKINSSCKKTLERAQTDFKSDIFGFGECIHRKYPKVWGEMKDNWDEEFTTLQVNFTADAKITDLGENMKPVISKEE